MRKRSPSTLTQVVDEYARRLVEREGSYDAAAKKLGMHRQSFHAALNGERAIRLKHLID
jgi:hypothetical protein